MVSEATAMLSAYEQSFTVYGKAGQRPGLSPDTLYRMARKGEEQRSFDEDVLRDIREETGAGYLFLARADRWDSSDDKIRVFVGISSGTQLAGVGRRRIGGGNGARPITSAALVQSSTGEVLWQGARFTGNTDVNAEIERGAKLGIRSLLVEAVTGRALSYPNFLAEDSGTLLVYRYGKGTVVATSARVERTAIVVQKEGGTTVRYPIHTVSRIKNTNRNKVVFPSHENPNVVRPDAQK
jgi:hypothetical protein